MRLPNELLGEFYRRTNGILEKIENGGLDFQRTINALQMVSEGKVDIASISKNAYEVIAIGSVIRVDRTVSPVYPDWMKELLHPELEKTGPTDYESANLEQWRHSALENIGQVGGRFIYKYLREEKILALCIGLADLIAIQSKGIVFFRQHFADKAVFGWKSIIRDSEERLRVPSLFGSGNKVILNWGWVDDRCGSNDLVVRFTQ